MVTPAPERDHIGAVVRSERRRARLNQTELAELACVGRRVVSELERGKSTLRMDVVNRVLAVFQLQLGTIPLPRKVD